MSVDNYDFVLEGGTCSLKYSLEPVAFYWRFLALGNRRGNENRGQWIAPLCRVTLAPTAVRGAVHTR